jgi:TrmH family RNA methyltransferase
VASPRDSAPVITSRRNPLIRELRTLVRASPRRTARCVVEGWRLMEAALDAGAEMEIVLVTPPAAADPRWASVRSRLDAGTVRWVLVAPEVLDALTQVETPQGILGIARCPPPASPEVLGGPEALVVVLDGIQDPGNVGAIIRTAVAVGATAAVTVGGTADPFSPKALRASAGAAFRLPLLHFPTASALADALAARGIGVVVADPRGAVSWEALRVALPVALVFGSERAGADPAWSRAGATRVRIPMVGPVESLNVAAAASVLLYGVRDLLPGSPRQRTDG